MVANRRIDPAAGRARGVFIGFVGPDGSGKTTVAAEIELRCASLGRAFAYIHWRPSLTSPFAGPDPYAIPLAKVSRPSDVSRLGQIASLGRLLRSALVFNIAYLTRLRPKLRAGGVIVVDRWIYNYIAQPDSVCYYGSQRVAAFVCCRLVVQPRPVFVLDAPPSVILTRSHELTEQDVESEYRRIRADLHLSDLRWIDATAAPSDIAVNVMAQCRLTDARSE